MYKDKQLCHQIVQPNLNQKFSLCLDHKATLLTNRIALLLLSADELFKPYMMIKWYQCGYILQSAIPNSKHCILCPNTDKPKCCMKKGNIKWLLDLFYWFWTFFFFFLTFSMASSVVEDTSSVFDFLLDFSENRKHMQ